MSRRDRGSSRYPARGARFPSRSDPRRRGVRGLAADRTFVTDVVDRSAAKLASRTIPRRVTAALPSALLGARFALALAIVSANAGSSFFDRQGATLSGHDGASQVVRPPWRAMLCKGAAGCVAPIRESPWKPPDNSTAAMESNSRGRSWMAPAQRSCSCRVFAAILDLLEKGDKRLRIVAGLVHVLQAEVVGLRLKVARELHKRHRHGQAHGQT